MSQTHRDPSISFLQIFGIWLVVIGHSFFENLHHPVHTWIYSFHMPLFMFISGYLFFYTLNQAGDTLSLKDGGRILKKKVLRLLVPYLVISTMAFFPKALLNRFALRPVEISWASYLKMLLYPGDNVIIFFWFLPTLFLIFCIVFAGRYGIGRWLSAKEKGSCNIYGYPALAVSLILLVLNLFNPLSGVRFLNLDGVAHYLVYFMAGYYFNRFDAGRKWRGGHPGWMLLLTLGLSVGLLCLPPFTGRSLLTAFNGILMSLCFSRLYVVNGWRFFHPYFGASYMIYLLSWFPQVAAEQILMRIVAVPWWVSGVLAAVLGFYLPFFVYKWLVRHKASRCGKALAFVTGHA